MDGGEFANGRGGVREWTGGSSHRTVGSSRICPGKRDGGEFAMDGGEFAMDGGEFAFAGLGHELWGVRGGFADWGPGPGTPLK
jgi:hypothetical protein